MRLSLSRAVSTLNYGAHYLELLSPLLILSSIQQLTKNHHYSVVAKSLVIFKRLVLHEINPALIKRKLNSKGKIILINFLRRKYIGIYFW